MLPGQHVALLHCLLRVIYARILAKYLCTLYACKPINGSNSKADDLELTMKGIFPVQVVCLSVFEME